MAISNSYVKLPEGKDGILERHNPAVFVGEKLSHLIVDMSIIDPRMMGPGPVEFGAH